VLILQGLFFDLVGVKTILHLYLQGFKNLAGLKNIENQHFINQNQVNF
jgi:hypothetical protein